MPSSSLVEMPVDVFRCAVCLLRYGEMPLGTVLGSWGDVDTMGGEKGPGFADNTFAELARRALSFSARSARKNTSKGDSSLVILPRAGRCCGVGASESVAGGEGSSFVRSVALIPGESRALAKKLGMGNEEGAGEAWNVAPANAVAVVLDIPLWGGVVLPPLNGPGDGAACFGRDLFADRGGFDFELLFCSWDAGLSVPAF